MDVTAFEDGDGDVILPEQWQFGILVKRPNDVPNEIIKTSIIQKHNMYYNIYENI